MQCFDVGLWADWAPLQKKTELCPFTPFGVVEATASPASDASSAGDVSMAEKMAPGAPQDGEGMRPYMKYHVVKCYPLWQVPSEFYSDG